MTTERQAAIVIERDLEATIEEVWDLWTTPDGIEAWWGPDGFSVTVHEIDLRPGGALRYAMTATGAEQIAFMEREGIPVTTELTQRFTEVDPPRRLAWRHAADFIPGVEPYEVGHVLELSAEGPTVRVRLTLEPMHDAVWTGRAASGWEMELGRLRRVVEGRRAA